MMTSLAFAASLAGSDVKTKQRKWKAVSSSRSGIHRANQQVMLLLSAVVILLLSEVGIDSLMLCTTTTTSSTTTATRGTGVNSLSSSSFVVVAEAASTTGSPLAEFPLSVAGGHWVGQSNCKGNQPVSVRFQEVSSENVGDKPIVTLTVQTNVTSIVGFEVRQAIVYYMLKDPLSTAHPLLNLSLADPLGDVYVAEAPQFAGRGEELGTVSMQFVASDAVALSVTLELLCGATQLNYAIYTPAPPPPRNATRFFQLVKELADEAHTYAPLICTVCFWIIIWLIFCCCCQKEMFGSEEALAAAVKRYDPSKIAFDLQRQGEEKLRGGGVGRDSAGISSDRTLSHLGGEERPKQPQRGQATARRAAFVIEEPAIDSDLLEAGLLRKGGGGGAESPFPLPLPLPLPPAPDRRKRRATVVTKAEMDVL